MATIPDARAIGALCLCLGLPSLAGGADGSAEFRFEMLDRTYEGFVEELAPIEMGLVEVLLRSPQHELTLEEHLAGLEALGDGEYRLSLHLRFNGHGLLDADLKVGVVEGKLEDELTLPSQALDLDGRVAIDGDKDGWTITLLEGPETVEVKIQSQMPPGSCRCAARWLSFWCASTARPSRMRCRAFRRLCRSRGSSSFWPEKSSPRPRLPPSIDTFRRPIEPLRSGILHCWSLRRPWCRRKSAEKHASRLAWRMNRECPSSDAASVLLHRRG